MRGSGTAGGLHVPIPSPSYRARIRQILPSTPRAGRTAASLYSRVTGITSEYKVQKWETGHEAISGMAPKPLAVVKKHDLKVLAEVGTCTDVDLRRLTAYLET